MSYPFRASARTPRVSHWRVYSQCLQHVRMLERWIIWPDSTSYPNSDLVGKRKDNLSQCKLRGTYNNTVGTYYYYRETRKYCISLKYVRHATTAVTDHLHSPRLRCINISSPVPGKKLTNYKNIKQLVLQAWSRLLRSLPKCAVLPAPHQANQHQRKKQTDHWTDSRNTEWTFSCGYKPVKKALQTACQCTVMCACKRILQTKVLGWEERVQWLQHECTQKPYCIT